MRRWTSWAGLLLALLLIVGCGTTAPVATAVPEPAATTAPAEEAAVAEADAPVVLTVEGLDGTTHELTMADLEAMPVAEGWCGGKSSTGQITPPLVFKGVLVTDLAALVGGLDETTSLSVVAKDGYAMTISYEQIANSDFITYDPGTGDEIPADGPMQVMVAYSRDGQPIPDDEDGPLRLAIINTENSQVVDGHWLVKWVTQLRVKSVTEDWVVHLEGAITDETDRATFESCVASNCHGETWTDDEGQEWTGLPLYYLAGRVDDEIKHKGPAYNRELANAGYTVDVIAADGYTVTFDSARLYYNDNILIANMVNGAPLAEDDFPLKLVGPDLAGNESAGQITQMVVHLPEAAAAAGEAATEEVATEEAEAAEAAEEAGATEEPTEAATEAPAADEAAAAPSGDAVLTVSGAVDAETAFSQADLEALGVVTLSTEHPKKGMQDYEGVSLAAVLETAGLSADASKLVFTASDGYTSELALSAVTGCADCLVAFGDDGSLSLVMPGMESSAWAKNLVQITVE